MNDDLKGLYMVMLDRSNTIEDITTEETMSAIHINIQYSINRISSWTYSARTTCYRRYTLYKHEQYDQETIFNNAGPEWNKNRKSRGKSS